MPESAALRQAFLSTTYGPAQERWRHGSVPNPDAPSWAAEADCWAILTAWNPAGQPHPQAFNAAAQRELQMALRGWPLIHGVNGEGEWIEASLIVPGLRLGEALALGRRFGQAALLWGCGSRTALVWCQPLTVERFWLRQSE